MKKKKKKSNIFKVKRILKKPTGGTLVITTGKHDAWEKGNKNYMK